MYKFLSLFLYLYFLNTSYSQKFERKTNLNIKIIKKVNKNQTTTYAFKNKKITSINYDYHPKGSKFFKYNKDGLLSSKYYFLQNSNIKVSINYSYNDDGYLTKIVTKEGDKLIIETDFKYKFNGVTNFYINKTTIRYGITSDYIVEKSFEMVGDILITIEKRPKLKPSIDKYTFEKGNIISLHSNMKNSKWTYSMNYKYDNSTNINSQMIKGFFGDKFFINSIINTPTYILKPFLTLCSNNVIEENLFKKGKRVGVSEYKYMIDYNLNNDITKIKQIELISGKGSSFFIEYE